MDFGVRNQHASVVPSTADRDHLALGRAIRAERERQGLSQEDLSQKSGLHKNYVGSTERGERNISHDSLLLFAKGLGLKASELLARAGFDVELGG